MNEACHGRKIEQYKFDHGPGAVSVKTRRESDSLSPDLAMVSGKPSELVLRSSKKNMPLCLTTAPKSPDSVATRLVRRNCVESLASQEAASGKENSRRERAKSEHHDPFGS